MTKSKTPMDGKTSTKAAAVAADEAAFVDKAQRLLRDSEAQIVEPRQQQLAAARAAALAAADAGPARAGDKRSTGWISNPWFWAPTGAMAATVLTIALLWGGGIEALPMLEPEELAAAQDIELLEDLEFVAWMLEEDVGAG